MFAVLFYIVPLFENLTVIYLKNSIILLMAKAI